ncbi:MAG: hypothetical protein EOM12_14530 [Verrucomicrobiae bacterium]|nr:hypothetical protein [Verrucomicrobiae bacterium]
MVCDGISSKEHDLRNNLVDMAVEAWRFSKVVDRMMAKLDAGEKGRYVNQFRWFLKKTEETLGRSGLRIVNLEGYPFDPGLAASPLNLEDFGPDDALLVDQMIEPVIMDDAGIVRTGTMMLRRLDT